MFPLFLVLYILLVAFLLVSDWYFTKSAAGNSQAVDPANMTCHDAGLLHQWRYEAYADKERMVCGRCGIWPGTT